MTSPISPLDSLARRVDQLVEQFVALRAENHGLRNALLDAQAERDALRERVETVAQRLEALRDQLPAE